MSPPQSRFGVITMRGGRYEALGMPLVGGTELWRYERLIQHVARSVYLREHPRRARAPKGFTDSVILRLTAIGEGSVVPVLERSDQVGTVAPAMFDVADYFETARELINDALRDVSTGALPPRFPIDCLREFAALGQTLREDEWIELSNAGEDVAVLNQLTRRRIQALAALDSLEVEVVVQGQITGLRSNPQQFDFQLAPSGRRITGQYREPATWDQLHEFQGYQSRAQMVSISVVADQGVDRELRAITDVLAVEPALPPEWAARLREIAALRTGWLFPDSPAPATAALDLAENFLLACVDEAIPRPAIFATDDAGVQLEWSWAEAEIELVVTASRVLQVTWFSKADDDEQVSVFGPDDVGDALDVIGARLPRG